MLRRDEETFTRIRLARNPYEEEMADTESARVSAELSL